MRTLYWGTVPSNVCVCVCVLGAGEAPGGVRAEAESSTEISVQWSGLSTCRLVNGNIIKYRVQFRVSGGNETRERETEGDWKEGGRVVLTGLILLSNYSISVAALNQNGDVGPYSDPVTAQAMPVSSGGHTHKHTHTREIWCIFCNPQATQELTLVA